MGKDKKGFVNVDNLIKDINIKMGLTLGTLKNVNVFPDDLINRTQPLIDLIKDKTYETLSIDESIALLKDGDILLNDIEACLKELNKDEMLTEAWEEVNKMPSFIRFVIKAYILLPLLFNDEKREEIKYKINDLPDGNIFKFGFLYCIENKRDTLFDGALLLKDDLLESKALTEEEINEILEEIACEESKAFEEAEGTKDKAMPTEKQKRYIRLRMGYDKE